eukprot:1065671-Pyramimonas_sp.AAC.1
MVLCNTLTKRHYIIVSSLSLTAASSFCSSCVVRARVPSITTPRPSVGVVACNPGCVLPPPFEIFARPFLH